MGTGKVVLRGIHWLQHALLWIGVACLALYAWYGYQATYYQAEYEQAFEQHMQESHYAGRAHTHGDPAAEPSPPASPNGEPVRTADPALDEILGRLEVPRLNMRVMVLKKADAAALRKGAGWIDHTAPAGEPGNMGLAGHRDTHFRPLEEIHSGDTIHFTTLDGRDYVYRVDWVSIVNPSHVEVLNPTEKPAMTLVTCYPFHYVGQAPKRFIVRASRIRDGAEG